MRVDMFETAFNEAEPSAMRRQGPDAIVTNMISITFIHYARGIHVS